MRTLDQLPAVERGGGRPCRFVRALERGGSKSKKASFPVVAAKQAAKVLEGLGKSVTGIHGHGDGSFTVVASATPAPSYGDAVPNEWDEVLNHG